MSAAARPGRDRTFILLFMVMLTIAGGNTALQSVLPALGRTLGVADTAVAAAFSVSAVLWMIAAPYWANRSDREGRRSMVLVGLGGFCVSLFLCGGFLAAGINHWMAPGAAFAAFVIARMIYGGFGSAAPPAVQALVAGSTTAEERTKALTLIASAFGLGTILGPAIAPYLLLGHLWPDGPEIGLAGPAFVFSLFGLLMLLTVSRLLPPEQVTPDAHGAVSSYPSIGGQSTGASVTAATAGEARPVRFFEPRVRGWMIAGLVVGHAQAMTGQTIGFLIIDRLNVAPHDALEPTGLVLMLAAGASLLAQWGIIPLLNLPPRRLLLVGSALGAVGLAATGTATTLYGIATGYAMAALGFGFARPGFTAGSSLAVEREAQGSVAGKVTSINGAVFVLGPGIGVGLYQLWRPLPYLTAGAALLALLVYVLVSLRPSSREDAAYLEQ